MARTSDQSASKFNGPAKRICDVCRLSSCCHRCEADPKVLFAKDDDGCRLVQITAAPGEVQQRLVVNGDSIVFQDRRASLDQIDLSLQQLKELLLVVLQEVVDAAVEAVGLTGLVNDVEHLVVPGVGVKRSSSTQMRVREEESVVRQPHQGVARHGRREGAAAPCQNDERGSRTGCFLFANATTCEKVKVRDQVRVREGFGEFGTFAMCDGTRREYCQTRPRPQGGTAFICLTGPVSRECTIGVGRSVGRLGSIRLCRDSNQEDVFGGGRRSKAFTKRWVASL